MVSILQLFILIIRGVAFSVLILEAWCQKAGSRGGGGGGGNEVRVEAARRPRSFSAGFSCRAFPEGPLRGLAGLHHLSGSVQKPQALRPQVHLVNEHLVVGQGVLQQSDPVKDQRAQELIPGGRECVSSKVCPPPPLLLPSPFPSED